MWIFKAVKFLFKVLSVNFFTLSAQVYKPHGDQQIMQVQNNMLQYSWNVFCIFRKQDEYT